VVLLLKSADIVKSEFHVIVKLNLCRSIHCLPLCTFLSPTLHAQQLAIQSTDSVTVGPKNNGATV
jgi:hypothetical protein